MRSALLMVQPCTVHKRARAVSCGRADPRATRLRKRGGSDPKTVSAAREISTVMRAIDHAHHGTDTVAVTRTAAEVTAAAIAVTANAVAVTAVAVAVTATACWGGEGGWLQRGP